MLRSLSVRCQKKVSRPVNPTKLLKNVSRYLITRTPIVSPVRSSIRFFHQTSNIYQSNQTEHIHEKYRDTEHKCSEILEKFKTSENGTIDNKLLTDLVSLLKKQNELSSQLIDTQKNNIQLLDKEHTDMTFAEFTSDIPMAIFCYIFGILFVYFVIWILSL